MVARCAAKTRIASTVSSASSSTVAASVCVTGAGRERPASRRFAGIHSAAEPSTEKGAPNHRYQWRHPRAFHRRAAQHGRGAITIGPRRAPRDCGGNWSERLMEITPWHRPLSTGRDHPRAVERRTGKNMISRLLCRLGLHHWVPICRHECCCVCGECGVNKRTT